METFENWVDLDLKVDTAVPIFVKDAEDLFNEDLRPQNKGLITLFWAKKHGHCFTENFQAHLCIARRKNHCVHLQNLLFAQLTIGAVLLETS